MKNISIGIDLGTSYSCVGVWNNDHVEIIANNQGNRIIPSCVSFDDVEYMVGESANHQIGINPSNTIFDIKRLLGTQFLDSKVQAELKYWPFKVINRKGFPAIQVKFKGDKLELSPEVVSSMILSNLKETAEAYLRAEVSSAVITVPAYFNETQIQATHDAATIAGLNVVKIINEPTAAGLAYGLYSKSEYEKKVLVFDLGGGTFDVSILSIKDGICNILASLGDTHLGGEDFNNRLLSHFIHEFKRKYKQDITNIPKAIARLRHECEKVKKILSTQVQAKLQIDSIYQGIDFYTSISRTKFEEMCEDLFRSLIILVDDILYRTGMLKSDIDEIVLVGGSTRIPFIQKMISNYFNGKKLNKSINPDEVVAYGATIQAAMLTGKFPDRLRDVTPFSFGVEIKDGIMSTIIKSNTPLPIKKTEIFTTAYDYQTEIKLKIFKGDRPTTRDNYFVNEFILTGIIPQAARIPKIAVTFHINSNGNLKLTAYDKLTGEAIYVKISPKNSRIPKSEFNSMAYKAELFREQDRVIRTRIDAQFFLESTAYKLKNYMKYYDLDIDYQKFSNSNISKKCSEIINWLNYTKESGSKNEIKNRNKLLNLALISYMMSAHNDIQLNSSYVT